MLTGLAIASCLSWVGLLLLRRGFWRADQRLNVDSSSALALEWPEVVAIIPARDEAAVISYSLPTVLGQDYPGRFQVVLVDDSSADGTVEKARAVAETVGGATLEVIQATPVPEGWTGKLWAIAGGLRLADALAPEARYVFLTDADIAHAPWILRALVCKAEEEGRHLVSVMAMLRCNSPWERLLIPAFVFFFQKLYPFPAVNDPRDQRTGAAGGCVLARRDTLRRAGDLVLIRDRIIDDCALGRLMKAQGPIWLGLSTAVCSLRHYDSLAGIWAMVTRTAFVQLEYRASRLMGTLLGMGLVYLTGPVALTVGIVTGTWDMVAAGAAAWTLMSVAYGPTLVLYRRSRWEALMLPVAACLYTGMTVDSALKFWSGRGGRWKGRISICATACDRQRSMRAVAGRARTSFFWAMALLGREQREAMFAIYAFCRTVDDTADEIADPTKQRAGLAFWREELALLYDGRPRHPIAMALEVAARRFSLRHEDCAAIIDGVEMDTEEPLRAPSLATLDMYCDRVAGAVGRLSVRVLGLPAAEGEHLSRAMGQALQLTNILRDVAEDAERGRLYLPRELLEAHGIAADIPPVEVLHHPALLQVCTALGTIARCHFAEAERVLATCPRRRARAAALMKAVYQAYLTHLEADGFRHHRQRVHLSRREKLYLIFRHMLI